MTAPAQSPHDPPFDDIHHPQKPEQIRLPNGKLQSDMILKADHEQSIKDVHQLLDVTQALQKDLEQEGAQHVLSLDDIRKTEEIEKLAKRIRARMRKS